MIIKKLPTGNPTTATPYNRQSPVNCQSNIKKFHPTHTTVIRSLSKYPLVSEPGIMSKILSICIVL